MAAAAHNASFAKEAGISQGVAKEFNQADKAQAGSKAKAPQTKAPSKGTHIRHIKPYVSGSRRGK